MNQLQQFQFYDKYARYNYEHGRRETFSEAVQRSVSYLKELSGGLLPESDYQAIQEHMEALQVMPSMRLFAMAGEAARRNNICIYNCSYAPIDSLESFSEMLTILMCGTGVGYSVESQYVNQLPKIKKQSKRKQEKYPSIFVVPDTSEGWADALLTGLNCWFDGYDMAFDYSQIRPIGSPLKVKGGTASGHEPLERLLNFCHDIILSKQGEKLTTLDCHDIACMIGDCVISGGVRRSALICLFDKDDNDLITCKDPKNIAGNEHRYNANNSAVWDTKLDRAEIAHHMYMMDDGNNGEPAFFSRWSAWNTMPARRKAINPKDTKWGTNPCGEIVLRPNSFCNLSIAVARADDTIHTLSEKVRLASIIGTIQSCATNFKGIRKIWADNAKEERLLGVDITGQHDCPLLKQMGIFEHLKRVAVDTNAKYAKLLGINQSASVTCVKPSGNSSILMDCASGLHARHSKYYIRRIRLNKSSPIAKFLLDSGFNLTYENGQNEENHTTLVVSFPVESPDGLYKDDLSALDQLNWWLTNKTKWTEHNPSCTVSYDKNELETIIDFVHDNQVTIGGISFLPKSDMMYEQMPYEEIDKEAYEAMVKELPVLDFSKLIEHVDNTTSSYELACIAGACEI